MRYQPINSSLKSNYSAYIPCALAFFFGMSQRNTFKCITRCPEDILPLLFSRRDVASNTAKHFRALIGAKAT